MLPLLHKKISNELPKFLEKCLASWNRSKFLGICAILWIKVIFLSTKLVSSIIFIQNFGIFNQLLFVWVFVNSLCAIICFGAMAYCWWPDIMPKSRLICALNYYQALRFDLNFNENFNRICLLVSEMLNIIMRWKKQ